MRLVDELNTLRERLPDPQVTFRRKVESLDWQDEQTAPLAQDVFDVLDQPQSLAEVRERVSCTTFALHEVVAELYESKQIA